LLNRIEQSINLAIQLPDYQITQLPDTDTPTVSLTTGTRLGPHEIIGLLGAGGMGEVYRAQDTKLNRQVAIKVLPEAYAADPERIARFHREAQAVAALNHPSIAAIYELAESGDTKYLVLELVEGDTLAERLRRGPVPVEEALAIAKQIIDALEIAHEKGICHRDLKPANVKLTSNGSVKVLDFGLAKFLQSGTTVGNLTHSPTLTLAGTFPGVILGTAGYMSPEQAKGFEADQRSDIFSFGCILFELLTGRQAFEGETASEILASVIKIEVDFTTLPPRLNPRLTELLRRCLEKNPKKRWHAAADVRVEIEAVMGRGLLVEEARTAAASARPLWKRAMPVTAALLAGGLIAGYGAWTLKPEPARTVTRFSVPLPEGQQFTNVGRQVVALSPDGTNLVYVANQRLYLRSMSGLEARVIAGSEVPGGILNPVFSPDGQALAFFSSTDRALKRLAITGGAAVTICSSDAPYGMSWDEHGIVFGQAGKGILRVSPNGGTPDVIAAVSNDQIASSPQMLPGGRAVLFSLKKLTEVWDKAQVVVQPLGTAARKTLVDGGHDGRYLPTGHLVYALSGVLLAVLFDLDRLAVSGGSVPIVEGVRRAGTSTTGTAASQFSYSRTGSLVYLPGPAKASTSGGDLDLALFDRKGGVQPLKLPPGSYRSPRVSPDGKSVAFDSEDDKEAIVSVYDLAGGSAMRRLTFGGKNRAPIWSPDGQWIAFQSDREGDLAIFRQRADGSGTAERLTKPEAGSVHTPQSWSPDGDHLLLTVQKDQQFTLWTMPMKDRRMTAFGDVRSAIATEAAFSPDGRWVAYQSYQSRETARGSTTQVFVQPFPSTGAKYLVPQTGVQPYWSWKGDELILNSSATQSFAIPVTNTPRVVFGRPQDFARVGRLEPSVDGRRNADAMPDGQHVIGVTLASPSESGAALASQITVVLNWFEEVRQRAPTRR
jgi:Tol biopolymer transport system component